jgi:uncharacterized protein YjbI with pentapeptide repeats
MHDISPASNSASGQIVGVDWGTMTAGTGQAIDPKERDRRRGVFYQRWTLFAQILASLATFAAVVVAVWVAYQSDKTSQAAARVSVQQAEDSQLSTALGSLGSSDAAERIAGLVLLEQNAADRLLPASITVFGQQNAYEHYSNVLDIFSGYLQSHGSDFLASAEQVNPAFGIGYGTESEAIRLDVQYALDELQRILMLRQQVSALGQGSPSLDLSHDELYGASLVGADFGWVRADLYHIDLRGADMADVQLSGHDTLKLAYLQCSNLSDADLRGVNLEHADLRGANLSGATLHDTDLTGANLTGADVSGAKFYGVKLTGATLTGMYGTASGLPSTIATSTATPPSTGSCLADRTYWDGPKK